MRGKVRAWVVPVLVVQVDVEANMRSALVVGYRMRVRRDVRRFPRALQVYRETAASNVPAVASVDAGYVTLLKEKAVSVIACDCLAAMSGSVMHGDGTELGAKL